jgi:hypothetical protein
MESFGFLRQLFLEAQRIHPSAQRRGWGDFTWLQEKARDVTGPGRV